MIKAHSLEVQKSYSLQNPKHHQKFNQPFLGPLTLLLEKISLNSVHYFLSYYSNSQTKKADRQVTFSLCRGKIILSKTLISKHQLQSKGKKFYDSPEEMMKNAKVIWTFFFFFKELQFLRCVF